MFKHIHYDHICVIIHQGAVRQAGRRARGGGEGGGEADCLQETPQPLLESHQ